MNETKDICDVCKRLKESTYCNALEKHMCDDCWDEYGEACHNGLA